MENIPFFFKQPLDFFSIESKFLCLWLNSDQRILYLNDFAAQTYGWSQDVIGKNFSALCEQQKIENICSYLPENFNHPVTEITGKLHIKNLLSMIQWNFFPIRNEHNEIKSIFIIGINIRNNMQDKNTYLYNVINNVPHTIFWKDKNSVFLGCNEAFAKFAQLKSPEEIIGLTDYDLPWKKSESDAYRADDKIIMETDRPRLNIEEKQTLSDGTSIILRTSKVPLHDKNGHVSGVLGVYTDITELKKIQSELHISREKAESSNRAKSEFIANMSHDIRTPLNGIIMAADLLRTEGASSQDLEHGKAIYASSQELLGLLNNVLDIAKIEHINENDIHLNTFSLQDVLTHLYDLMQVSVLTKGLELKLEIDPDLPYYVVSDKLKIQRILQNLLGNAIKFTHQGRVIVQVKLLAKHKNNIEIEFSVSDTGIGIPKNQQEQVFERFFRASPSYKGVYQGHGVGLYIVKRFINLLGGEIKVNSVENQGTRFYFSLKMKIGKQEDVSQKITEEKPLSSWEKIQPLSKPAPLRTSIATEEDPSSAQRILVVEDNVAVCNIMKNFLKKLSYHVTIAETAEVGIELFKTNPFDLVISDLGLPGLQGDEMTAVLRLWEKASNKTPTPIVALTAHADEHIKQSCLIAGMNQVYMKPFNEALLRKMLEWLEKKTEEADIHAEKKISEPAPAPAGLGRDLPASEAELFQLEQYPIFDEQGGIDISGGKDNLILAIKMSVEDIIPAEMAQIEKAYQAGDWDQVQKLAHKLKGGSLYCGTTRMTYACQYLERYWKAGHRKLLEPLYQQMIKIIEETLTAVGDWLKE